MPPTPQEVQVATESLRSEATIWLHQSDQMQAIAHKAEGLRMSRLEAGLFQLVESAYDAAADQVTARCREGQQRMEEIATTLRHVADTYEQEERDNLHRFKNLY
jgi:uncharacterized protein YukE